MSARPDSEYDESTDYPLHKPFTIKEYIKLVSYVIIAIVGGVAIAVLVFLANR